MAKKNVAVFGIYPNRASCEYALSALKIAKFRNANISILLQDNPGAKDVAMEMTTKAPGGAAPSADSGALIGSALGWLIGTGAIAIPSLGPFVIAGPIVAVLAREGGGTLTGLAGALMSLGLSEHEAEIYRGRIKSGGILLSMHCDSPDWVNRAKSMLRSTGAEDVSSTGEFTAD